MTMKTVEEHYHTAGRLLADAGDRPNSLDAMRLAAAQAHATLALAGATIEANRLASVRYGIVAPGLLTAPIDEALADLAAAGVTQGGGRP
jgi:hypothetical protein